MAVSEAQKKASVKYLEKLDEVRIRMPKGEKDGVKSVAVAVGESMNQYIINAIAQRMERDGAGGPQKAAGAAQEAEIVSLPSETFDTAQKAAEAVGESLPDFIRRAVETQTQRDKLSLRLGINPATGTKPQTNQE